MTMNEDTTETPEAIMYAVVTGEYSDYAVRSLWTTREAADAECKRLKEEHSGYDQRVEEYFLNAPDGRRVVQGYCARYEFSNKNYSATVTADDVQVTRTEFYGEVEDRANFYANHLGGFSFYCNSTNKETAVRLLLELVAQITTVDYGLKDPITFDGKF